MELVPGEITYLLQLISEDKSDIVEDSTKRVIASKLDKMRDESRESIRLLQKLECIALEHRQILEIIDQQRRLILK